MAEELVQAEDERRSRSALGLNLIRDLVCRGFKLVFISRATANSPGRVEVVVWKGLYLVELIQGDNLEKVLIDVYKKMEKFGHG